jgi:SAM dependent carboxyl methyltransferase
MSNEVKVSHGVMEGNGSYNRHARLPADGGALALPLLEKAVADLSLGSGDEPIVIADYGSSQGKNSQIPIQLAIKGLRERAGSDRPISVFHIDQPSNDFNTLFGVLDNDPNRYVTGQHNVYPAAIGRSFYESVLPYGSVHLGWSSYAAMWLSCIPAQLRGHFIAVRCNGTGRAAFDKQAVQDWEAFLTLRSKELRPGGRLVVAIPGLTDGGTAGIELIFDHANAALDELVAVGALTSEERARMVVGVHPRRKDDVRAPFKSNGVFQSLTLEEFVVSEVADTAWTQYESDRDAAALVESRALFFRSIFVPSLACALTGRQNEVVVRTFADQLERRLSQRLAIKPTAMPSLVQTMILAKGN